MTFCFFALLCILLPLFLFFLFSWFVFIMFVCLSAKNERNQGGNYMEMDMSTYAYARKYKINKLKAWRSIITKEKWEKIYDPTIGLCKYLAPYPVYIIHLFQHMRDCLYRDEIAESPYVCRDICLLYCDIDYPYIVFRFSVWISLVHPTSLARLDQAEWIRCIGREGTVTTTPLMMMGMLLLLMLRMRMMRSSSGTDMVQGRVRWMGMWLRDMRRMIG